MSAQTVEIEINPREAFRGFIESDKRYAVLVCHRRAGKSVACVHRMMRDFVTVNRPGPPLRFGYVAPTFSQAKQIIWQYLRDLFGPIPGIKFNESELRLIFEPTGDMVQLYSADSGERMRGLYFDGIYLDEYADHPPGLLDAVIRPALADYQGSLVIAGTPKGRINVLHDAWQHGLQDDDWFTLMLKADESGLISPDELDAIRRATEPALFAQEFNCSFAARTAGAIYAHHVDRAMEEGRIHRELRARQEYPLHLAFDIGAPVNTIAVLFQVIGDRVIVLRNFIGGPKLTTPAEWARMLRLERLDDATIVLPHDGAAEVGGQWEPGFRNAGMHDVRIVPRCMNVWDKIAILAETFPRIELRSDTCDHLLKSLQAYHSRVAPDGVSIRELPNHDWSSHACSALETAAQAIRGGLVSPRDHFSTAPSIALMPATFRKERARIR